MDATKEVNNSTKEEGVNNVYLLGDRDDIRLKIDKIVNSSMMAKLDDTQKGIINTVLKYGKVSDKQLKRIELMYNVVCKNNTNNNSHFLDDREDVKTKMTQVINSPLFKSLDKKTKDIFNTVLRNGRFSDKQLKYIIDSYNKLTEEEKNNTENKRYELASRPDLQAIVDALRGVNSLDDKTSGILDSVLKYGRVSDKQLKYLNMAYMGNVLETC